MIWDSIKRLQEAVSGLYDRADGVVSRLGSHPLSPLVMFLGILTTDGALVAVMDSLPQDLANQSVPSPSYDDVVDPSMKPR